ncbi:hypothetical protein N332_09539, partial [Mesitornis unicolor]
LFRIIRRDPQLLVRPGRRVGIGEVALGERHSQSSAKVLVPGPHPPPLPRQPHQHHVRVVPKMPEDPEPHEATEGLTPDHLRPCHLRELPVPRLDVHP